MTSKDFTNWLRGYITGTNEISAEVRGDLIRALDSVNDDTARPNTFYNYSLNRTGNVNTSAEAINVKTIL